MRDLYDRGVQIHELAALVGRMDPRQPLTDGFSCEPDTSLSRYDSQKDHLLGWMAQYGGPGAYHRAHPGRDAQFMYNHFRCAPGLLYLAEGLGEDESVLQGAMRAVRSAPTNPSSQAAAFRQVVPWSRIAQLCAQAKPKGLVARLIDRHVLPRFNR